MVPRIGSGGDCSRDSRLASCLEAMGGSLATWGRRSFGNMNKAVDKERDCLRNVEG